MTCDRTVGFFPGTPVSSTNKTDRHDITEILLKVALNTITLTIHTSTWLYNCPVFTSPEMSDRHDIDGN